MIIYFFPKVSTTQSKTEPEHYCTQAISVSAESLLKQAQHSPTQLQLQCILIFTCLFLSAEYFKCSLTTCIMKKTVKPRK